MIYLVDRLRADALDDDFPARYRRRHARDLGRGHLGLSNNLVGSGAFPARYRRRFRLMPSLRFHHRDTRHHRIAAVLADQHRPLSGFPLWQFTLGFRQFDDVLRGVTELDQRFSARQDDRIEKALIPRHNSPHYANGSAPTCVNIRVRN